MEEYLIAAQARKVNIIETFKRIKQKDVVDPLFLNGTYGERSFQWMIVETCT